MRIALHEDDMMDHVTDATMIGYNVQTEHKMILKGLANAMRHYITEHPCTHL